MRLPTFNIGSPASFAALNAALQRVFDPLITQLNAMSEGKLSASTNAAAAAPGAGSTTAYVQGDFIVNNAPAELGDDGAKYVVRGWICTASGKPGTWLECRFLTGN